jgi:DNA-binding beta-propeller fold protein YncE
MPDQFWVSDFENLVLTDTTGETIQSVTDVSLGNGMHTVNSSGELVYIDKNDSILKLCEKVTHLLRNTPPWFPECVYCSPATGDLLVGMSNHRTGNGKVTRYNRKGQDVLNIQHDNKNNMLYIFPIYITENKNGDIIVSDWQRQAVVVTDREGSHRFSYTGPKPGSLFPRGICTDLLSHILVCDQNAYTVQIIDKDGHFLSLLLTLEHVIEGPLSLAYDDKTHLLWVGACNNEVSVYQYLQRRHFLTCKYFCFFVCLFVIFRHTQQSFSYMIAVRFYWWVRESRYIIQCVWGLV